MTKRIMPPEPSLKNLTSPNFGKPPEKQNQYLQILGAPHVDSFDYMLEEGLGIMLKRLEPVEIEYKGNTIRYTIDDGCIVGPSVPEGVLAVKHTEIWPTECRQSASTYSGHLIVRVQWSLNGIKQSPIERDLGAVPIMIKSKACHLRGLTPTQLVEHCEHADEWGGYFIVKGHERLIRMLLTTRENYPVSIRRSTWKGRGSLFSDMGIIMRCVAPDKRSQNNILHYVTDGSAILTIPYRRALYLTPVFLVIKCLVDYSDETIYKIIMKGREHDVYLSTNVMNMMRLIHIENIHNRQEARKFFGHTFRAKFGYAPSLTEQDICDLIIRDSVCVHLTEYVDKFHCLVIMIQKLYSYIQGHCREEGSDSIAMQQVVLAGHLYQQILKERIQSWLSGSVRLTLNKKQKPGPFKIVEFETAVKRSGCGVERSMENFISTGNVGKTNLSLAQEKGLTIVAENINRMRYMSHFRAVHRGSFFQDARTTEARQLLPEAWGFICPVHTPDGTPCGLLNHLTKNCQITKEPDSSIMANLPEVLASLGMQPLDNASLFSSTPGNTSYITVLNGRLIGNTASTIASRLVDRLRLLKIQGTKVPKTLEIILIESGVEGGQYPGLFLFSNSARMMRPVMNLAAKQIELIGTFEQVFLDICITPDEAYPKYTSHEELSKTDFLSNLACLIPMPDYNQSPRNMYQCQMGKQTMGTPCLNWQGQAETKLYRLQTPASPLFRPAHYDSIGLDDFAMGTNAVVAVISYTGYDMEDAMIINKASLERGFAYGSIVKSEFVELKTINSYFGLDPSKPGLTKTLGPDGLPFPGTRLTHRDPYYCYYNFERSRFIVGLYDGKEDAVVDSVKLCGAFQGSRDPPVKACITLRLPRGPLVGDKFASRAGQKGICSQRWPCEDLPFTESGLVPDIVFNPHGFPSRMTIAMMIECMAGKSSSLHGLVHDASPFLFSENDTAIDYFGRLLEAGGYSYYGTERMYSGVDGCEMTADIFFGVIHYQRLRHMVSDKWQVRSTGATDMVTRQPVQGRKRGGGVRFGEMERDALISHGASFLLQDRLFHCSDKSTVLVCKSCGSILGPLIQTSSVTQVQDDRADKSIACRACRNSGTLNRLQLPYIFKYLTAQLASVNISLKLELQDD